MSTPRSLADWLEYIERQHPQSIELGLARVREVAQRMGLVRPAKQVIAVAGTNGKGSTVAFIEAIARAAGWRVGAYTSPHLLAYNERVRIDGVDASDADLVAGFEAVDAVRGETPLTYFEYATLAALWLFQRAELDLAVLEVGLGGRLDAVNLVDADVAVITTVDIDHVDWLGNDREAIGFEKVGIARAGKPLVLGEDDPPASVLGHAYAIGASAIRAGCDFFFEPLPDKHGDTKQWRWREVGYALDLPMPRLIAPVQLRNAATAIAALRALDTPRGTTDIDAVAIAQGVACAHISGRMQCFERGGVQVVVDVAHNPQAARELARWLSQHASTGKTMAVLAMLADKDATGVAAALSPQVDRWLLAGLDAGPRSQDAAALATHLQGCPAAASGTRHATVAAALSAACTAASTGDRIVVLGSFHTAAAAIHELAEG